MENVYKLHDLIITKATRAEYDAISSPAPDHLYIVKETSGSITIYAGDILISSDPNQKWDAPKPVTASSFDVNNSNYGVGKYVARTPITATYYRKVSSGARYAITNKTISEGTEFLIMVSIPSTGISRWMIVPLDEITKIDYIDIVNSTNTPSGSAQHKTLGFQEDITALENSKADKQTVQSLTPSSGAITVTLQSNKLINCSSYVTSLTIAGNTAFFDTCANPCELVFATGAQNVTITNPTSGPAIKYYGMDCTGTGIFVIQPNKQYQIMFGASGADYILATVLAQDLDIA